MRRIDYSKALDCRLTDEEKLRTIMCTRELPLYKSLMESLKKGIWISIIDSRLSRAVLKGYRGMPNQYYEGSSYYVAWLVGRDFKKEV